MIIAWGSHVQSRNGKLGEEWSLGAYKDAFRRRQQIPSFAKCSYESGGADSTPYITLHRREVVSKYGARKRRDNLKHKRAKKLNVNLRSIVSQPLDVWYHLADDARPIEKAKEQAEEQGKEDTKSRDSRGA
jgi:hypothetical protein